MGIQKIGTIAASSMFCSVASVVCKVTHFGAQNKLDYYFAQPWLQPMAAFHCDNRHIRGIPSCLILQYLNVGEKGMLHDSEIDEISNYTLNV